ncbi:MAG: hypothetical protein IJW40_09275 [Clostridia bacterium]|nr:hypothetical protein [Clostridia bacterium]
MKTQDCCTSMKECATSLWQKIKRPTVRQTLRYDFGIYPDRNATEPKDAINFHLGGTHVCPLWKIVLVAAVALITIAITLKCKSCDE